MSGVEASRLRRGIEDSGSQKVQHYFDVTSHKIKIVGPTIEVKKKNSTDLSWVAATRSKSVEFLHRSCTDGGALNY